MNCSIRTSVLLGALLLSFIGTACTANLVTNPDFDTNSTGWTANIGTIALDSSDGSPIAPSLQITTDSGGVADVYSACIQVAGGQNYDLTVNDKPRGAATASVTYISGNVCGTYIGYSTHTDFAASLSNGWSHEALNNFTIPTGVGPVQVDIAGGPSTRTALVDHVRFGPAGTAPVTLQAFQVQ